MDDSGLKGWKVIVNVRGAIRGPRGKTSGSLQTCSMRAAKHAHTVTFPCGKAPFFSLAIHSEASLSLSRVAPVQLHVVDGTKSIYRLIFAHDADLSKVLCGPRPCAASVSPFNSSLILTITLAVAASTRYTSDFLPTTAV